MSSSASNLKRSLNPKITSATKKTTPAAEMKSQKLCPLFIEIVLPLK